MIFLSSLDALSSLGFELLGKVEPRSRLNKLVQRFHMLVRQTLSFQSARYDRLWRRVKTMDANKLN